MEIAIAAILDYIMSTPENFNPNLFREFLTDEDAIGNLVMAYREKIKEEEGEETHDKDELSLPPTDPSQEK